MDGSVIRLIPNLKVSIDDLEIMDLAEDAQTVPIKLLLRTSWRPRLDEVRIMINKVSEMSFNSSSFIDTTSETNL